MYIKRVNMFIKGLFWSMNSPDEITNRLAGYRQQHVTWSVGHLQAVLVVTAKSERALKERKLKSKTRKKEVINSKNSILYKKNELICLECFFVVPRYTFMELCKLKKRETTIKI